MTVHTLILVLWIVVAAMMLAGVSAAILWAVRAGQFGDQERARYLPLRSGIPNDEEWAAGKDVS